MNLLTAALPDAVEICGTAWPIHTDFRVGVRFEQMMQDRALSDEERAAKALTLYYPRVPDDLSAALDGLLWFYSCGRQEQARQESAEKSGKPAPRAYDFEQDAGMILAAFRQAYGIDLTEAELHWWKFRALLSALPADCEFCRVCGYRSIDTKGMGKQQKQHYEKMRKLYALRDTDGAAMSLEERNQRMKEYVNRRFMEAEAIRH